MNHIPFTATPEHRRNLIRLAQYLLSGKLAADFDMNRTTEYPDPVDESRAVVCGKVGDVLGHGPYAGILKADDEGWLSYCTRCFIPVFSPAGYWLCENGWAKTDNTAEGAGRRIAYLLIFGVPETFIRQRKGNNRYAHDCFPEFYAVIPSTWLQIVAAYPQITSFQ